MKKTTTHGKIFTLENDITGDGKIDIEDLQWRYLEGDGDFRSNEIKRLYDEADMIITNPPFSLFRKFLSWIVDAEKQFTIIGNMNAITYKEVFPLIKENSAWLGATGNGSDMVFGVPAGADVAEKDRQKAAKLGYVGNYTRLGNSCWFTNIDHGRRHQPIPLMSMADNIKFNKKIKKSTVAYKTYDNYAAIEVPYTDAIPMEFNGVMGVPISFLHKYSPEQFEILGTSDNGLVDDFLKKTPGLTKEFVEDYYSAGGKGAYKAGNPTAGYYDEGIAKMVYKRIFIKHKHPIK